MTDLQNGYEPIDEVEALVWAAGDYVQASDDLRPRVLETARMQCREQRARFYLRQAAVLVALLAVFTTTSSDRMDKAAGQQGLVAWTGSDWLFARAQMKATWDGDYGSGLVDAFTELRSRQAEVLRLTW
ncbi:MAG: hypothetical protein L0Z07_02295 [Planctomycetes bacterium]|nr:hypothetical protein [Planctomycetota bacterium]